MTKIWASFFLSIMQPYVNLGSGGQAAGYDKEKGGIFNLTPEFNKFKYGP